MQRDEKGKNEEKREKMMESYSKLARPLLKARSREKGESEGNRVKDRMRGRG